MENQSNDINRYDTRYKGSNNNDTFRGENFINYPFGQQTKISTLYSGQIKLGTVNSSDGADTILAQTGNNIHISRKDLIKRMKTNQDQSIDILNKKIFEYIFQDFGNRLFMKNKLAQVHQNLQQLQAQLHQKSSNQHQT